MSNRIVCIIQARMGSTRLPAKVAMPIAGRPMLEHVIRRVQGMGVDEVVVATSVLSVDDRIVEIAAGTGVSTYRGSESDVLLRYYQAALQHRADAVVRVTADCPLLDPRVSMRIVRSYLDAGPDYVSNTLDRTYPRGLDTEVVSFDALATACHEAVDPAEREHVTPFVWRRPERFRMFQIRHEQDLSIHRWTVDTAEDLELVRRLYGALGDRPFGLAETMEVLKANPDWFHLNSHVCQKPVEFIR